jgi:hypothetical protein
MENLEWPRRRHLDVDLHRQRLFHVPTAGDADRPVGATGVFRHLVDAGQIEAYACYTDHLAHPGIASSPSGPLLAAVERFAPTMVLWQHPGSLPIARELLRRIKRTRTRPILGYDEKDVYLFARKRLGPGARSLAREADHVFLPGAGALLRRFRLAGARDIGYSPSAGDRSRFDDSTPPRQQRYDVVMVANRLTARRGWLPIQPLPQVRNRASLARRLSHLLGGRFALYGMGWDDTRTAKGPIDFDRQAEVAREARLTIGWDHANIPYNFSNRLPVMLLSGVAHVTNRHAGYDSLFRDGEHLFMARTVDGMVRLVERLLGSEQHELDRVGRAGQEWARLHYSTDVVYRRQLEELAAIREARPR